MSEAKWLDEYFERYREGLFKDELYPQIVELKEKMQAAHAAGKKTMIIGNGGSAAIASHCAVDFTKNAHLRVTTLNEASFITCLANDFGYENWVQKGLEMYADEGDLIVLISSSGKSPNMVKAAEYANGRGLEVVTFTGFDANNPLKERGGLNFWIDSRAYNVVEMVHHIWLLAACDLAIGSAEYAASPQGVL